MYTIVGEPVIEIDAVPLNLKKEKELFLLKILISLKKLFETKVLHSIQ